MGRPITSSLQTETGEVTSLQPGDVVAYESSPGCVVLLRGNQFLYVVQDGKRDDKLFIGVTDDYHMFVIATLLSAVSGFDVEVVKHHSYGKAYRFLMGKG